MAGGFEVCCLFTLMRHLSQSGAVTIFSGRGRRLPFGLAEQLRDGRAAVHDARGAAGEPDDGGGEIGVISSVSHAFCGDCSRARLSTEGKLYTCLFATSGHDLRALLRDGHSDAEISTALGQLWRKREELDALQAPAATRWALVGFAIASVFYVVGRSQTVWTLEVVPPAEITGAPVLAVESEPASEARPLKPLESALVP